MSVRWAWRPSGGRPGASVMDGGGPAAADAAAAPVSDPSADDPWLYRLSPAGIELLRRLRAGAVTLGSLPPSPGNADVVAAWQAEITHVRHWARQPHTLGRRHPCPEVLRWARSVRVRYGVQAAFEECQ